MNCIVPNSDKNSAEGSTQNVYARIRNFFGDTPFCKCLYGACTVHSIINHICPQRSGRLNISRSNQSLQMISHGGLHCLQCSRFCYSDSLSSRVFERCWAFSKNGNHEFPTDLQQHQQQCRLNLFRSNESF